MDASADADRTEAEREIVRATYRSLCERGYADLTMRAIAEEYGKSTAAIHYHYETKDDLLVALLEFLLERFLDRVHTVETTDPRERLDRLLDVLLDHADDRELVVGLLEMRAQAPYDEEVREQLVRNAEYVRYLLRTAVADGVERGAFASNADPEAVADGLMTIVDGARTRFAVFDDPDALRVGRDTAAAYAAETLER